MNWSKYFVARNETMICQIKQQGLMVGVWDDQEGPRAFSFRTFFLLNLFPLFQIKVEPLNSYFSIIQRKKGTFRNQWQSLYSFRIICRGLGLDVLLPNLPTCHLVESFAWVDFKRSQAACGSPVKRASIIALPASLCFITDIFSELFIGPMCTWSPIIWSPCVSLCLSLWEVFET